MWKKSYDLMYRSQDIAFKIMIVGRQQGGDISEVASF